jgi:hypothetical protein
MLMPCTTSVSFAANRHIERIFLSFAVEKGGIKKLDAKSDISIMNMIRYPDWLIKQSEKSG